MTDAPSHLRPVPYGKLPDYPFKRSDRLDTHYFLTLHYDRLLNSTFGLKAENAVFGLGIKLYCLSQKQTPIGTLPIDPAEQAALVKLSEDQWHTMCLKDPGPLYNWVPCLCGNETRLMHGTVVEMIKDAFDRKLKAEANQNDRNQAGRLATMTKNFEAMGSTGITQDPFAMEWMDNWLLEQMEKGRRRTPAWYARALQAHYEEMNTLREE